MIALIRYFVQRRRIKAGFPVAPPPIGFVGTAFAALPRFQYDVESFDPTHEGLCLQDYLNAKAREGWKLHTIAPVQRAGYTVYLLTWEKLKREGIANADKEDSEEEARA
jgi:hypothetical protein